MIRWRRFARELLRAVWLCPASVSGGADRRLVHEDGYGWSIFQLSRFALQAADLEFCLVGPRGLEPRTSSLSGRYGGFHGC